MKKIIKIIVCVFLFYSSLPAQSELVKTNEAFDVAALQNYGVVKLSDIFSYMPDWYAYSIDGFRWQLNSDKSAFDQSQSWLLMIDGQRVDLGLLNMKNINLLPITFAQIESIESSTRPQLIGGEFSERGFINIATRKPSKGFSFNAYVTASNETGDPGPYKYTKYRSQNIDIIGPDFSTLVSFRNNEFNASVSYKTNRFLYPTSDEPVSERIKDYDFKYRKIFSDGLSAMLNIDALPTKPKLTALYSTSGKYNFISSYGSDLLYFVPSAKELPVDTKFLQIGLTGSMAFDEFNSLEYSVKFSSNKMKIPVDFEHPDFDWKMNNTLINISYKHEEQRLYYSFGSGLDLSSLKTQYDLYKNTNNQYKLYSEVGGFLFPDLQQSLQIYLGYDTKRVVVKGSFVNNYKIDDNNSLKLNVSYSQRNVTENNDIWYWHNMGYNLFERFLCNTCIANHVGKNYQFNVETGWEHYFSRSIAFESKLFFNKFTNLAMENYSYVSKEPGELETELSSFISHVNGSSGGFKLSINHDVSSTFSQKFCYNYFKNISGDKLFQENFKIFPEHKILYTATYSPASDLFISFSANMVSKSKWKSFEELEGESSGYIKHEIPTKIICNASVQKWFAGRKLRMNLAFKNIFNQENFYTPNGAYSNFTMALTAELSIN